MAVGRFAHLQIVARYSLLKQRVTGQGRRLGDGAPAS